MPGLDDSDDLVGLDLIRQGLNQEVRSWPDVPAANEVGPVRCSRHLRRAPIQGVSVTSAAKLAKRRRP